MPAENDMDTPAWLTELEAAKADRLKPLIEAGRVSIGAPAPADGMALLKVALANEVNVSDLAATWTPSTPEVDVKIAFARQAGDEANHFMLVQERMAALGFDPAQFALPGPSPLFDYLKSLGTTVERVAAGLFTLESIAYGVNENFMAWCERARDLETVRIYRDYIQPDERAHQMLGQKLLAKYAVTLEARQQAREAVMRTLEIAGATRAKAAERFGTACFPGC
jgi:uncharacterized ferritin-like protein (DUF455 family)